MEVDKKKYEEYVKEITPVHSLPKSMACAFLVGGVICLIGQLIANSVVAPAIEFHAEGEVFGVGCKIFTIAGPVILYGVLTSWVLGLIYWVGGLMGIFQI